MDNHPNMSYPYLVTGPSSSGSQMGPVKYPGPLRTLFKDPYWSGPVSEISTRGARESKLAADAMGQLHMPAREKDLINDAMRSFNIMMGEYQKAVEAKDKEGAQKCAKRLEEGVRVLSKAHTDASNVARTILLHQAEQTKIKEAYTFISSRSSDDIILTSPRRKILSKSAVIPPEVALHTMAWLNEGHLTKRILWLRGPQRCGKSTILHRMASLCQSVSKPTSLTPAWVAGIAFDRPYDNESFVNHFLATVIHQVAERFDSVKSEFARISACWDRETYFRETEFGEQVDDIFIALLPVVPRGGRSPIIISLDGLDNCDSVALDKAFDFIEKTVESRLPIYFIIAASDTGKVQHYLARGPLGDLVHVNDVPDFCEMTQGFPREPSAKAHSSRLEGSDSGVSA